MADSQIPTFLNGSLNYSRNAVNGLTLAADRAGR
jgi:hypothetical protein